MSKAKLNQTVADAQALQYSSDNKPFSLPGKELNVLHPPPKPPCDPAQNLLEHHFPIPGEKHNLKKKGNKKICLHTSVLIKH